MSIDRDYLRRRLKDIEEIMKELKRLCSKPISDFSSEEKYAMRYQIIMLAEAIGSICIHISMEDFNYEPESYGDCLSYLSEKGVINCADDLKGIIRMRNLLVHRYWTIDDARIYEAIEKNFRCVESFSESVVRRYGG